MGLGAIDAGRANLEPLVEAEVCRWYDLFFSWSRGLVPQSADYIRALHDAFAHDFRVVLTDGRIMDREAYCLRLWNLHGIRSGSPKSQVCGLSITPVSGEYALAVFDLVKPGIPKKKIDSALIRRDPDAPLGVSWVYVHESEHALA
jgi:hypothetical protein